MASAVPVVYLEINDIFVARYGNANRVLDREAFPLQCQQDSVPFLIRTLHFSSNLHVI